MSQRTNRPDIKAVSAYLSQQPDVVVAYLFGSEARDQANRLSDVDIAVLLDPGLTLEESVERQLQMLIDLGELAQITILNRASPVLAFQAIKDGILLHARDRVERVAFEVHTMKTYFDARSMLEFHSEVLMKRIQEVGLGRRTGRPARTLEAAQRIRDRLALVKE